MSISIIELIQRGAASLLAAGDEAEKGKAGTLRGGSSGIMLEDGSHAGHCLASTYLRFRGVQVKDPGTSRELMFEAGRTNEDSWYEVLKASGYPGPILREEEIPVTWYTKNGIKVTGRPDIVLCDAEKGLPVKGLELKLVSSIWTARTVKINKTPKLGHLIQAGFYMWQVGVPFELWYTSRTDFECSSDFNLQSYPAYGTSGSEGFSYRFYKLVADPSTGRFKRKTINEATYHKIKDSEECEAVPGKYLPFTQGFQLFFDTSGRLWYRDVSTIGAEAVLTIISKSNIESFYETLSTLTKVPGEPKTLKPDGKKGNFKLSAYCTLGDLCCQYTEGQDIETWAADVAAYAGIQLQPRNSDTTQSDSTAAKKGKAKSPSTKGAKSTKSTKGKAKA